MALKTIKVKRYEDIVNEYPAEGAILPGSLLSLTATNGVVVNAGAADAAGLPKYFALEDELQGKTIEDAYAATDPVQVWVAQPGEEVLAVIDGAFAPDIGDLLETAAGGELQAVTTGLAVAQVVDTHFDDDSGNRRVVVRII